MNIKVSGCENYSESLPGYVDYMVNGRPFPRYGWIEEHLAGCPSCLAAYADLLGMALIEEMDGIIDLSIGRGLPVSQQPGNTRVDLYLTLELCHHWLQICRNELIDDSRGSASALAAIGFLMEIQGNLDKAMEYYDSAQEMAQRSGNDFAMASALGGKGQIELARLNPGEAFAYLKAALELQTGINDEFAQARSHLILGDILAARGRVVSSLAALKHYLRARRLAERTGYSACRIPAENRIKVLNDLLATALQDMVSVFIGRYVAREIDLLGSFCREYLDRCRDAFYQGQEAIPAVSPVRLGFGAAEVKTPSVLSTIILVAQDILSPEIEDILAQRRAAEPEELVDNLSEYLKQKNVRQRLIKLGRQQGLSNKEADAFYSYLVELLRERPELFFGT